MLSLNYSTILTSKDSTKYILGALPDNYKLFEGTRHEGTKLRKEVFVYGHPEGPKKRYRAAREFIPHLAWLSSDETLDSRNCECKFCAPPDAQKAFDELNSLQIKKYAIKVAETKAAKSVPISYSKPVVQPPTVSRQNSISSGPGTPASTQSKQNNMIPSHLSDASQTTGLVTGSTITVKSETPKTQKQATFRQPWQPQQQNSNSVPTPPKPIIAPNQKPTPPLPHLSPDQKLDSLPQKFMFRQGEIVWFIREHGRGAVGLAVILSRSMLSLAQSNEQPRYVVQPLSHPFFHPTQESEYEETWLKPWLAYSPPDPFHETLRNIDMQFYNIPWKEILDGKWGEGDVEADSSIFASRTVDGTYTVFEPIAVKAMERSYNGVFFGGEKIWRGEAVRLAGPSREGQILIVSDILEVTPAPAQPTELIFVGDVYIWKSLKPEERAPPSNSFLPQLVNLDLNYRNEVSRAASKPIHVWHFLESRARFSWEDLKGRWYASRYLVPGLSDDFQQQVAAGDVVDAGKKINSQGDYALYIRGNKSIVKKETRALAFGTSIPSTNSDFGISEKQYTTLISSVGQAPTKSAVASNQLGTTSQPGYTTQPQTSSQVQTALQQQYARATPAQRQQIEKQHRILMAQQAARQSQQRLAHEANTSLPNAGQDAMDLDFGQFIN